MIVHTERRTPMPEKIAFAGGNGYRIRVVNLYTE
jgi:hypothetical protein